MPRRAEDPPSPPGPEATPTEAGSRFGLSSQSKRNAAQKVLELLQLTLTRCYLLLLRAGAARCCCCVSLAKIQRPAESLSPFQLCFSIRTSSELASDNLHRRHRRV